MKKSCCKGHISTKGFTLIEVLVVVLIIGVLTAVAVPQYQKAVQKSRFNSLLPTAKSIASAEEVYFMEHGSYGPLSELDVRLEGENMSVEGIESNQEAWLYVQGTHSHLPNNRLAIYLNHSPFLAKEIHCEALVSDARAKSLCKDTLGGVFIGPADNNWNSYRLNNPSARGIARGVDVSGDGHLDGTDISAWLESELTDEQADCMLEISLGDFSCADTLWPED